MVTALLIVILALLILFPIFLFYFINRLVAKYVWKLGFDVEAKVDLRCDEILRDILEIRRELLEHRKINEITHIEIPVEKYDPADKYRDPVTGLLSMDAIAKNIKAKQEEGIHEIHINEEDR